MNTFKAMFSIIFVIGMIVTIPIIQASETTIAITPESETLLSNSLTPQYLLFDTPKIGASQNSWDDYVASINWADYIPSHSSSSDQLSD